VREEGRDFIISQQKTSGSGRTDIEKLIQARRAVGEKKKKNFTCLRFPHTVKQASRMQLIWGEEIPGAGEHPRMERLFSGSWAKRGLRMGCESLGEEKKWSQGGLPIKPTQPITTKQCGLEESNPN